ncbi:MAG: dihydropteroate synthase [Chloroflexota bacterium]
MSLPATLPPLLLRGRPFAWGTRTRVMGILNVTPDSFSGDGLLAAADPVADALARALAMATAGAEILDIGGESTRPGHVPVDAAEEMARVLPVIRAVRAALPDLPLSIDTTKPAVAAAALDEGADLLNDVAAGAGGAPLLALAAERGVPIVLMHGRREAPFTDVVAEVCDDLARARDRALAAGCRPEALIADPGIGFGKAPTESLALLRALAGFHALGLPLLLGASRKSVIGHVLGLPPDERREGTLATTVLAAAARVDIVRVHDVAENVRAARMADAIVRGLPAPEVAG